LVIPQSPTLFSGCTVRENLDLFGIHSDEAIQKALEDAHLGEAMVQLPQGYESMVSEGGSNFSVGQRQLLCLAGAILSKNKLLILDEATASVDRRTGQMLHDSLHESFGDATILAVAHQLDTVIRHDDYILVLGQGKVLLRSGGTFSKMVQDTGMSCRRICNNAHSPRKSEWRKLLIAEIEQYPAVNRSAPKNLRYCERFEQLQTEGGSRNTRYSSVVEQI
jgi:ATP-binding cassette subfamily C (CFTR/MRP) protein 4